MIVMMLLVIEIIQLFNNYSNSYGDSGSCCVKADEIKKQNDGV